MMKVTKSLSVQFHHVDIGGQTKKYQTVPQLISTLRQELVFWPNLPDKASAALNAVQNELAKTKNDLSKVNTERKTLKKR